MCIASVSTSASTQTYVSSFSPCSVIGLYVTTFTSPFRYDRMQDGKAAYNRCAAGATMRAGGCIQYERHEQKEKSSIDKKIIRQEQVGDGKPHPFSEVSGGFGAGGVRSGQLRSSSTVTGLAGPGSGPGEAGVAAGLVRRRAASGAGQWLCPDFVCAMPAVLSRQASGGTGGLHAARVVL